MVRSVLCVLCPLSVTALSYTPDCITGTSEVYMPRPQDGQCFCGARIIEPDGGYYNGFCSPYPKTEGLSFDGCRQGDNDPTGEKKRKCQFYCLCLDKKNKGDAGKLSCCRPRDRFGLQDKVIIAAPAPPPRTGLPTRWPSYGPERTITTVTTTSEPYYGKQKLVGNIEFSTVIPFKMKLQNFLHDPDVTRGVTDGIAIKLRVPTDWVTAALSIPDRYIQADYQIAVPAIAPEMRSNLSAWGLFIAILESSDEGGRNDWGDLISTAMYKWTEHDYKVAVHSVPSPTIFAFVKGVSGARANGGCSLLLMALLHLSRTFMLWACCTHCC